MAPISCAQKLSITGMSRYNFNQIKSVESRCGQNDSALKGGRQQLHCVFCTLGRIFLNSIMYMIPDILTLCVLVTFF